MQRFRQTLDILTDMELRDERVQRDARILRILRDAVLRTVTNPVLRAAVKSNPTLYSRFDTSAFPLRKANGPKLPAWRYLSFWMKVQVASLALAERGYRPFKVHLHDDLREGLEADGKDQRVYLRDRIRRQLRVIYGSGNIPMFYFVIEDLDKDKGPTRPHAHGAIEIRPLTLDLVFDAKARRHLARVELSHGVEVAEREAGRWAVRRALKSAAGLEGYRKKVSSSGLHQMRNVWMRKPTFAIFNQDWVTYVFKNAAEHSTVLGENRLAFPYDLRLEAQLIWAKIRG